MDATLPRGRGMMGISMRIEQIIHRVAPKEFRCSIPLETEVSMRASLGCFPSREIHPAPHLAPIVFASSIHSAGGTNRSLIFGPQTVEEPLVTLHRTTNGITVSNSALRWFSQVSSNLIH